MIEGKRYDKSIDLWSLGVILFQMVHGYVLYPTGDSLDRASYIKASKPIVYTNHITGQLKDLLTRLLERDPRARLTMEGIFTHPWMKAHEARNGISLHEFVDQNLARVSNESSWVSFKEAGNNRVGSHTVRQSRPSNPFQTNERKTEWVNSKRPLGEVDEFISHKEVPMARQSQQSINKGKEPEQSWWDGVVGWVDGFGCFKK